MHIALLGQAVCKFCFESVFLEEALDTLFNDWCLQDLMNGRAQIWVFAEHELEKTGDSRTILSLNWSGFGFNNSAQ